MHLLFSGLIGIWRPITTRLRKTKRRTIDTAPSLRKAIDTPNLGDNLERAAAAASLNGPVLG